MNLGPFAGRNEREREYAEMVDETVVYPALCAARALLRREGVDAGFLDWVPETIWPAAPDPAPAPAIDPAWLTSGAVQYSTALPGPMRRIVRDLPDPPPGIEWVFR